MLFIRFSTCQYCSSTFVYLFLRKCAAVTAVRCRIARCRLLRVRLGVSQLLRTGTCVVRKKSIFRWYAVALLTGNKRNLAGDVVPER
jgi:hypothetical protein